MNSPELHETLRPGVATVCRALELRPETRLLAIAGIPGSGKSTLSEALRLRLPGSVVIPMDGYHLPRRQLDDEGLRRRGAPFTFDPAAFHTDLVRLKETRAGVFPAFDHAEQDPRADAIRIGPGVSLVIVEGLYVLLKTWQTAPLFDFRIFVDCDVETALRRVAARHLACGLCATDEEAWVRVDGSDRLNAQTILADGCRERADLVIHG